MSRGFLSALQIADSALPIGRYVHSSGLEALLADDPDATEGDIAELVESFALHTVGPLDGVVVAEAHRAAARADVESLVALDHLVTLYKLTPASRIVSTSCGQQLAALAPTLVDAEPVGALSRLVASGITPGNLAVVEGTLAQALGIGCAEAVLIELRGSAASLLSAAVRLGRLSALRAPSVLRSTEPVLLEAAETALRLTSDSVRSWTPEFDVHALRHRRAEVRLFTT